MAVTELLADLERTERMKWLGIKDERLNPLTNGKYTATLGQTITAKLLSDKLSTNTELVPHIRRLISPPGVPKGNVSAGYHTKLKCVELIFEHTDDWLEGIGGDTVVEKASLGKNCDGLGIWATVGIGSGELALAAFGIEVPSIELDEIASGQARVLVQPVNSEFSPYLDALRDEVRI